MAENTYLVSSLSWLLYIISLKKSVVWATDDLNCHGLLLVGSC